MEKLWPKAWARKCLGISSIPQPGQENKGAQTVRLPCPHVGECAPTRLSLYLSFSTSNTDLRRHIPSCSIAIREVAGSPSSAQTLPFTDHRPSLVLGNPVSCHVRSLPTKQQATSSRQEFKAFIYFPVLGDKRPPVYRDYLLLSHKISVDEESGFNWLFIKGFGL
jgi:hypothetical protein